MTATEPPPSRNASSAYYESPEARLFYRLLGGVKHFGYYPEGQERLPMRQAQALMSAQVGEALELAPGMAVLEAGCGEGAASLHLAQTRGVRAVGVDLLPWNVRRARRRAARSGLQQTARFEVMDYQALSLPDAQFDAVYTLESLVHVPRPARALAELYRVLKPVGRLALFEYEIAPEERMTDQQRSLADYILRRSGMEGLRQFEPGVLPRLVAEAGFDEIQVRDLTPRVLPMLRRLYRWSWLPYQVLKLLNLRDRALTVSSVVELYPHIISGEAGRYIAVTARKGDPGQNE